MEKIIQGFSKLSRDEKIRIASGFAADPEIFTKEMHSHWHAEGNYPGHYEEFAENTVSNFFLPYNLAPNFRIDGKDYVVPMVTDESSVVAAASAAAKFWWSYGGFRTKTGKMLKPGHVHFIWKGSHTVIEHFIEEIRPGLYGATESVVKSMKARGGGIESIDLKDMTDNLEGYFQLEVIFSTADAMGANFINTCLESMAEYMLQHAEIEGISGNMEIVMAVLSNYTPQCLVECSVSCPINELGESFVHKFETAVLMARVDVSRAVTHNKGIFNGIDAVLIATGNDFRAVEAAGHAWASRDGTYKGLTKMAIEGKRFNLSVKLPMAVGVVGGLTSLHPLAKASLQLLGNPGAGSLMSIAASAGLANHFSAIKALITGGIQRGHMKLHLSNILNQLEASQYEKEQAITFFRDKRVSYTEVRDYLLFLRIEK